MLFVLDPFFRTIRLRHPHQKIRVNSYFSIWRYSFVWSTYLYSQPFWFVSPLGSVGIYSGSVIPPGNSREWSEIPPFKFFSEFVRVRKKNPPLFSVAGQFLYTIQIHYIFLIGLSSMKILGKRCNNASLRAKKETVSILFSCLWRFPRTQGGCRFSFLVILFKIRFEKNGQKLLQGGSLRGSNCGNRRQRVWKRPLK